MYILYTCVHVDFMSISSTEAAGIWATKVCVKSDDYVCMCVCVTCCEDDDDANDEIKQRQQQ